MRLATLVAAIAWLALSGAARSQFADVQAPTRIVTAVPFALDITLSCPPQGEAPPPRHCDGSTGVYFSLSDRSAMAPRQELLLVPNETTHWGPFTFHKPGRHSILLYSDQESDFLGGVVFVVQPPAGPIRIR
jgi:hypothetical protein